MNASWFVIIMYAVSQVWWSISIILIQGFTQNILNESPLMVMDHGDDDDDDDE